MSPRATSPDAKTLAHDPAPAAAKLSKPTGVELHRLDNRPSASDLTAAPLHDAHVEKAKADFQAVISSRGSSRDVTKAIEKLISLGQIDYLKAEGVKLFASEQGGAIATRFADALRKSSSLSPDQRKELTVQIAREATKTYLASASGRYTDYYQHHNEHHNGVTTTSHLRTIHEKLLIKDGPAANKSELGAALKSVYAEKAAELYADRNPETMYLSRMNADLLMKNRTFHLAGLTPQGTAAIQAAKSEQAVFITEHEKQERELKLKAEEESRREQLEKAAKAREEAARTEERLRERLGQQVADVSEVIFDKSLSAEEKTAQLRAIKENYCLTSEQFRDVLKESFKLYGDVIDKDLTLDEARALRDDLAALDRAFGKRGQFGANDKVQERLASRISREERELERQKAEAEKLAAAQRLKEAQDEAAKIILDRELDPAAKVAELRDIQERLGLSEQGLRDLLGPVFRENEEKLLEGLSLDEAKKLQEEMQLFNEEFKNGVFGFQENNRLERKLEAIVTRLTAEARQAEAERLRAEGIAELGAVLLADGPAPYIDHLVKAEQIRKEHGLSQKEVTAVAKDVILSRLEGVDVTDGLHPDEFKKLQDAAALLAMYGLKNDREINAVVNDVVKDLHPDLARGVRRLLSEGVDPKAVRRLAA